MSGPSVPALCVWRSRTCAGARTIHPACLKHARLTFTYRMSAAGARTIHSACLKHARLTFTYRMSACAGWMICTRTRKLTDVCQARHCTVLSRTNPSPRQSQWHTQPRPPPRLRRFTPQCALKRPSLMLRLRVRADIIGHARINMDVNLSHACFQIAD